MSIATLDVGQVVRVYESKTDINHSRFRKIHILALRRRPCLPQRRRSLEAIAEQLGCEEVAVAALFYGQRKASPEDIKKLSEYFNLDHATLNGQLGGFPDRGESVEMPPREPLMY